MPRDAPIELRFNRFLLPETASRQSIRVFVRYPDLGLFLVPEYDVVERVVSYRPYFGGLWEADALHTIEIPVPTGDSVDGFRALDGTPLEEGAEVARFVFWTARAEPAPTEPAPIGTCAEVLDLFTTERCDDDECASCSSCHGPDAPAAGMRLDSAEGIAETVIGRVAHETETGAEVGAALASPPRFGAQMPRIDPGNPGNSYLLYKLLAKPENYGVPGESCSSAHEVDVPDGCPRPSDEEIGFLTGDFVRLDPMPAVGHLAGTHELSRLAAFIRTGARLEGCP